MVDIQTILEIPDWIEQGLKNGEYIRVGSVIREASTKQIVAMLREVIPSPSPSLGLLTQVSSVASILTLGVSVLNLGVSVIGFALILKHLKDIEQQIEEQFSQVQENINNLHRKFDISVYANFTAALGLAHDAITMLHPENRRNMATSAINRFFEAQHIYNKYVDISIDENINLTDKYILSLSLTYIARARCYLELEEVNSAISCLNEGNEVLRRHVEKYVKALLISQPIARVSPNAVGDNFIILGVGTGLESDIELNRLAQICKWLEPELNNISNDVSILFEAQLKNLVTFLHYEMFTVGAVAKIAAKPVLPVLLATMLPLTMLPLTMLPLTMLPLMLDAFLSTEDKNVKEEDYYTTKEQNISYNLVQVVEIIEQIIETYNRFEAYLVEVQLLQQLGMSFQDWLQLSPPTKAQQNEMERIYIIPFQLLDLK